MPPLEPPSRNRTSQLTGNWTCGRAAGCIREQEEEGRGGEEVSQWARDSRMGKACLGELEPSRTWSPGEPQCGLNVNGGASGYLPDTPLSPSNMGSGDSALDREPPESEQSSRSGPIILDRGPRGSFALSTCWVGRATRSPETGGMAWPSETTSNSEPSRASASLHRLTPLKPTGVGPGSQIPEDRDFGIY